LHNLVTQLTCTQGEARSATMREISDICDKMREWRIICSSLENLGYKEKAFEPGVIFQANPDFRTREWKIICSSPENLGYKEKAFEPGGIFQANPDFRTLLTKFEVQASGNSYGSDSLKVTVKNTGALKASFKIPAGALWEPADKKSQPLIVQGDYFATLLPSEQKTITLNAHCGNASRSPPHCGMSGTGFVFIGDLSNQNTVWEATNAFK